MGCRFVAQVKKLHESRLLTNLRELGSGKNSFILWTLYVFMFNFNLKVQSGILYFFSKEGGVLFMPTTY